MIVASSITGIKEIIASLNRMKFNGTVKAGILKGAVSQNVGRSVGLGSSNVLDYAPIQEFGGVIRVTKKMRGFLGAAYGLYLRKTTAIIAVPSRPFLRTTYQKNFKKWIENFYQAIKHGRTGEEAVELVGMRMQDDIIMTIKSNMPPPNSGITRKIKEKYAPGALGTLQFTGTLLHSIAYEVAEQ